eukprot:5187268-Prymnesium_polylepis.1
MTATRAPLEPAPLLPRGIAVHGQPPAGAAQSRRLPPDFTGSVWMAALRSHAAKLAVMRDERVA